MGRAGSREQAGEAVEKLSPGPKITDGRKLVTLICGFPKGVGAVFGLALGFQVYGGPLDSLAFSALMCSRR